MNDSLHKKQAADVSLAAVLQAITRLNAQQFNEALSHFEDAIKQGGAPFAARCGKALSLLGLGRTNDASVELQKLLNECLQDSIANKTETSFLVNIDSEVNSLLIEQQVKQALGVIRVQGESLEESLNSVVLMLQSRSFAEARDKLSMLIASNETAQLNYFLGLCYTGLGDLLAAKTAFERELELNPEHREAREFLDSTKIDLAKRGQLMNPQVAPVAETPTEKVAAGSQLRFLQVHGFYDQYIGMFYQRHPELVEAPYSQQMQALLDDGFSAPHLYSPYISEYGYDSELIIANCPPLQARWCIENNVRLENPDNWRIEITRQQIEVFKPDVIFLGDCVNGLDATLLHGLSHKPRVVMGWRAATIPDGTDWSGFDAILSGLSALREIVGRYGAKEGIDFYPGYPERFNEQLKGVEPDFDITFCGQWTTKQHPQRNHFLTRVAEHAATKGYTLGLFLSGEVDAVPPIVRRFLQPASFGVDMLKALKRGRITIDARGLVGTGDYHQLREDLAKKETTTMRMFEATGAGAFLLAQYHSNLSKYFEDGVEMATFCDEKELLEKIDYYLANPVERELIRKRGQQRCLTEHSMTMRAKALDTLIRERITEDTQKEAPRAVL